MIPVGGWGRGTRNSRQKEEVGGGAALRMTYLPKPARRRCSAQDSLIALESPTPPSP